MDRDDQQYAAEVEELLGLPSKSEAGIQSGEE
jgi:hypothetical protein